MGDAIWQIMLNCCQCNSYAGIGCTYGGVALHYDTVSPARGPSTVPITVPTRGDQKVLQLTVIESISNEIGFLPLLLKLFLMFV